MPGFVELFRQAIMDISFYKRIEGVVGVLLSCVIPGARLFSDEHQQRRKPRNHKMRIKKLVLYLMLIAVIALAVIKITYMEEADSILMYGSSLILFALNVIFKLKRKKPGLISLIIQLLYSSYCYYGLFFDLGNGLALAYFLYLLFVNCIHIVVLVVYFFVNSRG